MSLPAEVTILGIPHRVIECADHFNADTHFGEIKYAACEIRVNKDMPEEMKKQTLIHEMLHGIFVMIGRNDLTEDETLVCSLASAINESFTVKERFFLP